MTEDMRFWAMKDKQETPKVGVGVFLMRGEKVFLQLRKGSHGPGEWSLPGGHMDLGESFLGTCAREVDEETGVVIDDVVSMGFTNDVFLDEGLHYVTLFFKATWDESQEPRITEPDFCEEMGWFEIDELPEEIFELLRRFMSERRENEG